MIEISLWFLAGLAVGIVGTLIISIFVVVYMGYISSNLEKTLHK